MRKVCQINEEGLILWVSFLKTEKKRDEDPTTSDIKLKSVGVQSVRSPGWYIKLEFTL